MGKIHLISGDDPVLIREAARKVVARVAGPEPDDFALEIYQPNDERRAETVLDELLAAANTPSLLGGEKTIWLKDFDAFDQESTASDKRPGPVAIRLQRLAEMIRGGWPDDTHLVIDGPGIDKRKRLYKAVGDVGEIQIHDRPDMSRRDWRPEVKKLILQAAAERGMRLAPEVAEFLIEVVGVDTGRIGPELDKLLCYAGEVPDMAAAATIASGSREAVFYALNNAFGERDLNGCYQAIGRLLDHSKDAHGAVIGLLRSAARYFRDLIQLKLMLHALRVRRPDEMSGVLRQLDAGRKDELAASFPLIKRHPYFLQMRAAEAGRYSGPELIAALSLFATADRQLVSSAISARLLLETLALRIVSRGEGA